MARRSESSAKQIDPVNAVKAIHEALQPFTSDDRDRILGSVAALLGMQLPEKGRAQASAATQAVQGAAGPTSSERPQSIREVIEAAQPATNAQYVAVFAYYRERVEGLNRFARSDLRNYFARARLKPPANYDRDFANAILAGWIHEDGADSYLTSKGLEAVQAGFGGKRTSSAKTAGTAKKKSSRGSKKKR